MKIRILLLLLCVSTTVIAQTDSWENFETKGEVLARHENALAKVGNKVILIGGRGNKPLNILDLETGQWDTGAQPPFEIHHLQAVALDGLLYVLGGFTGGWPNETPLSHVLIYDPAQDLWITGPEIPENRRRGAAGVAVHDDKIYMINGIINGHTSGWVNWFDEYDPYTGQWKILPNSPVARDHFHAAVIDNKLYAAGGRRSGSVANKGFAGTVKETNMYDFDSGKWETLADIPTPRAGSTVAVLDGNLVVLGGESDSQEVSHSEVELYDSTSKSWRELPFLKTGRHGTQAVTLDNKILIGAGSGNRGGGPELTTFELYSAEENPEIEADSLHEGKLTASTEELQFSPDISSQNITISNSSKNKAIPIVYLQSDSPDVFQITSEFELPLLLAPGATREFTISAKQNSSEAKNGILYAKPAGANAPLEIPLLFN